jgi:hypothetical protein
MRGSGPRILFAASQKISECKHMRDAAVLARGFAVVTFVPAHAWVGLFKCSRRLGVEIKRMDAPSLTGAMRIALANLQLEHLCILRLIVITVSTAS